MKLIICWLAALASQSVFGLDKGLCTGSGSEDEPDHCKPGPMPSEEPHDVTKRPVIVKTTTEFIPIPEPAGDCPNHQVATWSSTYTTGKLECVCHCCEAKLEK